MNEHEGSIDWRMLREFAAVDLTKSFVLSWRIEAGTLLIDVDLYLTPGHPFYEKPRPVEKVCIRPAVIEFPYCKNLKTDGDNDDLDLNEGVLKLGLGAISAARRLADGNFAVGGEFGAILIDAERPILRLKHR